MRKRERVRIEKLQREIKAEQSRLNRQQRKDRSHLKGRAASEALSAILQTRDRILVAQRKLGVAKLAPSRATLRDIAKRPQRYKKPSEQTKKLRLVETVLQKQQQQVRKITLNGSEGRAETLLMQAFRRGERLDDVYKRIAKETGLSAHAVYSIGKYKGGNRNQDVTEAMTEMGELEGDDSPDDFDDF